MESEARLAGGWCASRTETLFSQGLCYLQENGTEISVVRYLLETYSQVSREFYWLFLLLKNVSRNDVVYVSFVALLG